jgi:hypothetical protein
VIHRAESGQMLLESILVGLLLLVPLLWALTVLADLHRGALAATAAVREAGFDAARASDRASAEEAVEGAVAAAFVDHGLDPGAAHSTWSAPSGLTRGGLIEVRVSYPVAVFRAPFLGEVSGPSVAINASHVTLIDPFRSEQEGVRGNQ